jgi:hypothetical protein
MGRSRRSLLAAAAATALAGCPGRTGDDAGTGGEPTTTGDSVALGPAGGAHAYTTLRPTGNRTVAGRGRLPDAEPVALPVEEPAWLLARATSSGSVWAVLAADGTARAFRVRERTVEPAPVTPGSLPAGMPPVLTLVDGEARLVEPPAGLSATSCPTVLGDGALLFVTDAGAVVRVGPAGARESVAVDALPDARVVADPGGDRAYVLGGATGRYAHAVLGDATEAGELVVLGTAGGLTVERRTAIPAPAVVEGTAPLVGRLAGERVVVTESDRERGARLVAYDRAGRRVAAGEAVGGGFRWRHQLAVAPFGPGGQPELAAVRTPHIGGTAEFYREREGRLERVATLSGYSSHAIGSRNLDGGLAGDLDGDGRVELLVPTDDRSALAAVRRTGDGAVEPWRLSMGGRLRTNLFGLRLADGGIAVGAGHAGGVSVWT